MIFQQQNISGFAEEQSFTLLLQPVNLYRKTTRPEFLQAKKTTGPAGGFLITQLINGQVKLLSLHRQCLPGYEQFLRLRLPAQQTSHLLSLYHQQ